MKIEYCINEYLEDKYELTLQDSFRGDSELIVHCCAEDYHDNHDGWEDTWPIKIRAFEDGHELGVFNVEREYSPEFIVMK